MDPSDPLFLALLKRKSNLLNKECQTFQTEIKAIVNEIMAAEITDETKSKYNYTINKLCDGYSTSLNRLEIEYLIKCEKSLQPQNTSNESTTPTQSQSHSPSTPKDTNVLLSLLPKLSTPRAVPIRKKRSICSSNESNDLDNSHSPNKPTDNHSTSSTDNRAYQCDKCKKEFKSHRLFQSHTCFPYMCTQCNKGFKRKCDLKRHIDRDSKHTGVEYKCDICSKLFKNSAGLNSHKALSHKHKKRKGKKQNKEEIRTTTATDVKCDECGARYTSIYLLRKHMKTDHLSNECDVCHRMFDKQVGLAIHMSRMHPTIYKKVKAENAEQSSDESDDGSNESSEDNVLKENVFACEECDQIFEVKPLLDGHIRDVHGGYPHKCNECDAVFRYEVDRKRHMNNVHRIVNGSVFECNECDLKFGDKMKLNRHRNAVHVVMDSNPLKCDVCCRVFASSEGLKAHKLQHEDVKDSDNDATISTMSECQTAHNERRE
eukprot:236533_1